MSRFILISFAFLAYAFYDLSGGAGFDAEATRLSRIDAPVVVEEDKRETLIAEARTTPPTLTVPENVTRVSLNLTNVNDILRPQGNLRTERVTRVVPPAPEPDAPLSEEEPVLILPSLIESAGVITPVDFSAARTEAPEQTVRELRSVTGNSVNVRGGPGTSFSVVNRLSRGDQVEILQDPGNGWVKLRPLNGGSVGWMADFLLSKG